MTETSCLTPHQELKNRLGTEHPQRQLLVLLDKIGLIETILAENNMVIRDEGKNIIISMRPARKEEIEATKLSRSEKMKAAWIKRKAKAINKVGVISA